MKTSRWYIIAGCVLLFPLLMMAQTGPVIAMEYFVDNDPGVGLGTAITITAGADVIVNFQIPTSALNKGFHTLFIRAKNDTIWGLPEARVFYVDSTGETSNQINPIAASEWFYDNDPGVGSGTTLAGTGTTVDLNSFISTASFLKGFHTLFVRSQDNLGKWGLPEARVFYVDSTGETSNQINPIAASEWFYDNDPGVGSGTILAGTGATVDLNSFISTASFLKGFHTLFVRSQNNLGKWGLPEARVFYVDSTGETSNQIKLIAASEWFFDNDPGVGSGTTLAGTGATVDLNFYVPTTTLLKGFHTLCVRSQDNLGKWGISEARAFYVDSTITTTIAQLAKLEYFFNSDPGIGAGIAMSISPSEDSVDLNLTLSIAGLDTGTNKIVMRVQDANGRWGINEIETFQVQLPPLAAPQNLTATAGNCQVTLKWNKNTEIDFLKYLVYMGADSVLMALKDSSTASILDTTKIITGLSNGTKYYFRVSALNSARLESGYSDAASATPSLLMVSGTVAYANTAATPIGNVTVTLTPTTGTALTTTSSATDGVYSIANVPAGTYTLTALKAGNWGGVNATDALLVVRHFVGLSFLSGLALGAADVNNSGTVNATDALLIVRRFVGLTTSFAAGDWLFNSQPVTIGSANVTANISGLAVGDVNASYTTSGSAFAKSASISLKGGTDKFSISASSPTAFGAVTMKLNMNSAKFASVSSNLPGLVSNVTDAGVSLAWFAQDGKPIQFNANEAIVTITLADKASEKSSVTIESELADIAGAAVNNDVALALKEIPTVFELSQNYPNPFNPSTQINYSLPQSGMVTLAVYNLLGQEVAKLVHEQKEAGTYIVQWAPKNLASGVYIYRIHVQTEKESVTSVKRLTLLK